MDSLKRLAALHRFLARRFVLFYGFFLVATPICLIFYLIGHWPQGEVDATRLIKLYLFTMVLGAVLELVRRQFPSMMK